MADDNVLKSVPTPQIRDIYATVSISGPPGLVTLIWDALTKTGVAPEVVDGEVKGIRPHMVIDGNFSDDRRNPGFTQVRFAKLIWHVQA